MAKSMTDAQREADSRFWRQYFGLTESVQLPNLNEDGRCDRDDCRGYRIPGYISPKANPKRDEQIWLYCPQCHGEALFPLKPHQPQSETSSAPQILELQNQPVENVDADFFGGIRVINLKTAGPGVLRNPLTVYMGRQIEWRGEYLHDSPLRNFYRIGRDGDRTEVCEKNLELQIKPALERRKGPIWKAILALARRVAAGEKLTFACWCMPERCHACDVAAAVRSVARELTHE